MTLLDIIKESSNWDDVYDGLQDLSRSAVNSGNENKVGRLFEDFCKCYFLEEPSVNHEYKNVWLLEEIPSEIMRYLVSEFNLHANADRGIDLVLQRYDGQYIAVQCKFRSDQDAILHRKHDDLHELFSEAKLMHHRMIFTNSSGLDHESLRRETALTIISLNDLRELTDETIRSIENLISNKAVIKQKLDEPRSDQSEVLDKVISGFKSFDRGQLILPCGYGKTLMSLWIHQKLESNHTLVLVPSLALLRQTKKKWHSQIEEYIPYISVCSEKDINMDEDNAMCSINDIGGDVSTDVNIVNDFLLRNKRSIVYCTYQSLSVIKDALSGTNFIFDLAICDEAHKTAGDKKQKFALIHDASAIPVTKRLYMTATPKVLSQKLKKNEAEDCKYACDMSNPEIYGPEFYRMSFGKAIEQGILVDYEIWAIGVNDEEVGRIIRERLYVKEGLSADEIANNYALEKFMKERGAAHAITFHSTIKCAKEFAERHRDISDAASCHVSGKLSTNSRNKEIEIFKNAKSAVITNARCLTEGVDMPHVDTVYFCDPKNSLIDIVQASGRALRTSKCGGKVKEKGYIVVPIFHNQGEKLEDVVSQSNFNNLVTIVKAMCAQDERLNDEINSLRIGKGLRIAARKANGVLNMDSKIIKVDGFECDISDRIILEMIDRVSASWYEHYGRLKEHYMRFGNAEYETLSGWISNQRKMYANKQLSEERVELLNKIGFSWNIFDDRWIANYQLLKQFFDEFGHTDLSKQTAEVYKKLAGWCNTQRSLKKNGILPIDRIERLELINFEWEPLKFMWNKQYYKLKKCYEKTGSIQEILSKDPALKKWTIEQRGRLNAGKISQEQEDKLIAIQFSTDLKSDIWEQKVEMLIKFKEDNGHVNVPHSKGKISELSTWCVEQRTRYKQRKLSAKRIEILESIGFVFNRMDAKWIIGYNALINFVNEFGHSNVPCSYKKDGASLGNWVSMQRKQRKNAKLSSERIVKLDQIGFFWEVKKK